ncbi:MAG: DNA gyrase subunit A [Chloroflexi bacterium]|nr:DNA gyrase subunit A [Chloroflexota bacterium]
MTTAQTIRPVRLVDEMRGSYLDYAMSVIVARALPDVRDGLKPVQRRIIYSMDELAMRPGQPYKKSARLVGEVLGKYHPHGDSPVYEAMVRMAQDFSMRYPLIDGQGNFGSIDNDPPAAMRYTEARLSPIAMEMLADIDRDTVDFSPNFDGSLTEPTILPARLPNLILNGASGIAVGMTTSIPPHNLREVCDAIIHLIGHPQASIDDLLQFVQGPDFPTGAQALGKEGMREAYHTGRGRVVIRAKMEVEEVRGGRFRLVVTEVPFQVNKAALVEKIATLAKEKKIDGITEVRDESDRHGLRVVVELRRDAQVRVIQNNLLKHTALQSAFYINMLALVDGQPQTLSLKALLEEYVKFRTEVIRRRTQYDIRKAQARVHILEGLRIAINNLDAIVRLIRNSPDTDAARQGLMGTYGLDEAQAQAILELQLRRLAALERQKIEEEYQELVKLIAELQALLADPAKVRAEVSRETLALKEKFGDERRTEIVDEEPEESSLEERIPHQEMVLTLSQRGYIKSIPVATYRRQHRGGKGVRGQTTREDDSLAELLVVDTHDTILFFTNRGRVYRQRVYLLPQDASRTTKGTHLVQHLNLREEERVQTILDVSALNSDLYLVLATRLGEVKRMSLAQIVNLRSNGLNAMDLEPGDELVAARIARETDEIMMVSREGYAIRFPVHGDGGVPSRSRAAGGVKGMNVKARENDYVVAMDIVVPGRQLLVISEKGVGKPTPLIRRPKDDKEIYRSQKRGGMGLLTMRITPKSGPIATARIVAEGEDLLIVSEKGQVTRTSLSEIREKGRLTQGVNIVTLDEDDKVVAIAAMDPKASNAYAGSGNGQAALAINGRSISTNGYQEVDEEETEEERETG